MTNQVINCPITVPWFQVPMFWVSIGQNMEPPSFSFPTAMPKQGKVTKQLIFKIGDQRFKMQLKIKLLKEKDEKEQSESSSENGEAIDFPSS